MVHCEQVSVLYANQYGIRNLNMVLNRGETCAIVGESGCGKTTLLHAIAGLLEVTDGQVVIENKVVEGIRSDTAIILQEDGLLPWKTVYDNAALGLTLKKHSKDEVYSQVWPLLETLNLEEHAHKFPIHLSGGQQKRVAIARALVMKPKLLLMDEPTGSLDMITKEAFQDQIMALYKQYGFTMMVVTHDIEEAVFLGQKIVVMKNGQITAQFDNSTFLSDGVRNDLTFYEMCLKVRKELSL